MASLCFCLLILSLLILSNSSESTWTKLFGRKINWAELLPKRRPSKEKKTKIDLNWRGKAEQKRGEEKPQSLENFIECWTGIVAERLGADGQTVAKLNSTRAKRRCSSDNNGCAKITCKFDRGKGKACLFKHLLPMILPSFRRHFYSISVNGWRKKNARMPRLC
ncbi:hypothetical protein niasHS_010565 [Heterodera schachtii]|uniref:Uncharacterized protein n=1 Tax=Heterodera schachtii TaxID=97005 RepID=A0ABD2J2R2_HETSC